MCEQSANLEASEESWFLLTVAVLHMTLQTWRQEHEGEEGSGSWAGKQKSGVASTARDGCFFNIPSDSILPFNFIRHPCAL